MTEESPVNPQTAYAICKTMVERDLKSMAGDVFRLLTCATLPPMGHRHGCVLISC